MTQNSWISFMYDPLSYYFYVCHPKNQKPQKEEKSLFALYHQSFQIVQYTKSFQIYTTAAQAYIMIQWRHSVQVLRLRSVPSPKEKSTLLSALGTQLSRFRHPHLHTVLCIQLLSAAARQFLDLGKPRFGRKESIFQGQARGRQENTPLKLVSQSTSEAPWTKTNAPEPTLLPLPPYIYYFYCC